MSPLLSSVILRAQSDARLVQLARDGHERAFEAIVERYRAPLQRHCRRLLPRERAEDVVQQTFLSAWSALREQTDVQNLRAWLYRIARNAALNAAKAPGYQYDELRDSLSAADDAHAQVERRAVIRKTLAGVAALPPAQREALLRVALEGESRAAVARDLRVSEGAVRQLVHRARATLRAGATAITPLPLAAWAGRGHAGGQMVVRIAQLAGGGGSAGAGGSAALIAKAGVAAVAAGAVAAPPLVHHLEGRAHVRDAPAVATAAHAASSASVRRPRASAPTSEVAAASPHAGGGSAHVPVAGDSVHAQVPLDSPARPTAPAARPQRAAPPPAPPSGAAPSLGDGGGSGSGPGGSGQASSGTRDGGSSQSGGGDGAGGSSTSGGDGSGSTGGDAGSPQGAGSGTGSGDSQPSSSGSSGAGSGSGDH